MKIRISPLICIIYIYIYILYIHLENHTDYMFYPEFGHFTFFLVKYGHVRHPSTGRSFSRNHDSQSAPSWAEVTLSEAVGRCLNPGLENSIWNHLNNHSQSNTPPIRIWTKNTSFTLCIYIDIMSLCENGHQPPVYHCTLMSRGALAGGFGGFVVANNWRSWVWGGWPLL